MSKISDISKEGQETIWKLIYGNQIRNFLCMNAIHTCEKCGNKELLFAEASLKLGFKPLCNGCNDKKTLHNLDLLDLRIGDTRFEWTEDNPHMRNEGNFGCRTCQPKAKDD